MNNLTANSNSPMGYNKAALKAQMEEEGRKFWPSEKGVIAEAQLIGILQDGAKPLDDSTIVGWATANGITLFNDRSPHIAFLQCNDKFLGKRVGFKYWCGLKVKEGDEAYWPSLKTFWGVVAESENGPSRYNERRKIIYDAGIENHNQSVDIAIPPALNCPPNAAIGSFVVGQVDDPSREDKWMTIFNENIEPFMVRVWSDFIESETGSLDDFLKNKGQVTITPKFKRFLRNPCEFEASHPLRPLHALPADSQALVSSTI